MRKSERQSRQSPKSLIVLTFDILAEIVFQTERIDKGDARN